MPDPRRPGAFGAAHADPADAYAGVPILQEPKWHNEVAAYFYLGGISAGAEMLGALADLSGARWRPLARTAHVVSFAAMVPCAPLLIADLGRPTRFYHMFRIVKPSSPMNLGTWTLLVHSAFVTLSAASALADEDRLPVAGPLARRLPARPIAAGGLPPALALGGYTGVLIGTTSVPVWSTSPLLGGLFMASAIASGTSAVSLAATVTGRDTDLPDHAALGVIGIATGATELGLVGGYLATSGPAARPLLKGSNGALLLGAVASTALAAALDIAAMALPARQRLLSAAAATATLTGGAMLRWAVIRAGHASATDRDANLESMRATPDNPGWAPPKTGTGPRGSASDRSE
jgi:formate-dependent nitrite reductase membrane component NrfD